MASDVTAGGSLLQSKYQTAMNRHRLNFKLKTSRPKAGISLPKKLFGIPEEAELYLFVENHISVNYMTEQDHKAVEMCVEEFSQADDKDLQDLAVFLKIFYEGGFAYNKKKRFQGGFIPINASIACLGLTPAFDGQAGIATGYPYKLPSTHLPFVDTVPVTIGGIREMSNLHARYGLCFTRCVHVWEGADFATSGVLDFSAVLPHGGFYYVPSTLHEHWDQGGLVYAFGENKDTPMESANEDGAGAASAAAASALNEIQVCFVMDCTGSMGSWIEAAKTSVVSMADSIMAEA